MKKLIEEFKKFISRGNVVDMAVGIIIGSAFTAIVTSLVNDVITPVIAKIAGKTSFEQLKIVLTPATEEVAETAIYYGAFMQKIIDFLLIAIVVFIMVKAINVFHKKKEEVKEPPKPDPQIELLTEIRDILKKED